MLRIYYCIIIILFWRCSENNSGPFTNDSSENHKGGSQQEADTNSFFGEYVSAPNEGLASSGIRLRADSTYHYYYGSCLSAGYDSGRYWLRSDTIYFNSFLEKQARSQKDQLQKTEKQNAENDSVFVVLNSRDMISPLTGDKYLYRNKKIYWSSAGPVYNEYLFWQKKGTPWRRDTLFALNGTHSLYNKNKLLTKKGEFRNNILWNGLQYVYSDEDRLMRVDTFKNGEPFLGKDLRVN